jgi:sugar O-acyltransferase (sialic acid O-acetyltransferase NeuD family)
MTLTPVKKLIVFGAGGHGQVVADVAIQAGWSVAGFVDDRLGTDSTAGLKFPILGDRAWLASAPKSDYHVALGIGDNYARGSVAEFLRSQAIQIATIISPSAVLSPTARIGAGTVVMHGAVVNVMAVIGEGVIINTCAVVEHHANIGMYAHISPNSTLGGGVEVGNFAQVALGSTVLPFLRIGNRSILGAGSVAIRAVPDDVVAFGVPARRQRSTAQKPSKPPA